MVAEALGQSTRTRGICSAIAGILIPRRPRLFQTFSVSLRRFFARVAKYPRGENKTFQL
jgi:hypothetical protein